MAKRVETERQEFLDTYYFDHGPCCAGCDWWRSINTLSGECQRSAPMSGAARLSMLGISGSSLSLGAGHALTNHGHHCGEFKDEFDWASLPLPYRKRIGYLPVSAQKEQAE